MIYGPQEGGGAVSLPIYENIHFFCDPLNDTLRLVLFFSVFQLNDTFGLVLFLQVYSHSRLLFLS